MRRLTKVLLFGILLLAACSTDELPVANRSPIPVDQGLMFFGKRFHKSEWNPTADNFLSEYCMQSTTNYIDFLTARRILIAELETNYLLWHVSLHDDGVKIIENPRVVLDRYSIPRFYEYAITEGDTIVAIAAVNASKEKYGVEFFFPFFIKRENTAIDNMMYDVCYPTVGYESFSSLGSEKNCVRYEDDMIQNPQYEDLRTYSHDLSFVLSDRDTTTYSDPLCPDDELLSEAYVSNYLNSERTQCAQIYSAIELYNDTLRQNHQFNLMYNDEAIARRISEIVQSQPVISVNFADGYNDNALLTTHWSGYCGPSALCFIYIGKYRNYPRNSNFSLRVTGDGTFNRFYDHPTYSEYYINSDLRGLSYEEAKARTSDLVTTDNGLSKLFYDHCLQSWLQSTWTFPMYESGLKKAIREATNDIYGFQMTLYPTDRITLYREPVLRLHALHYSVFVAVGCTNQGAKYFLCKDNGYIKRHSEDAYKCYPFWEKYNCFDIFYGLKVR